jgi:uncharacterized Zn finger protein (UPF0148 family)
MSEATTAEAAYAKNKKGEFVCPECDRTYGLERALKRHLSEKHGAPLSASAQRRRRQKSEEIAQPELEIVVVDEDSVSFQVRSQLRELALPLRDELSKIERRLVTLVRETSDLREAKAQIERMLRNLEGQQAQVQSGAGKGQEAMYRKKVLAVQEYLHRLPEELQGGFTASALAASMKAEGISPVLSAQAAAAVISELHDQGILRLDRVSRGGGNSFIVVGRNGNSGG